MRAMSEAIEGAAMFKDMLQKVEAGARPAAPVSAEVAAWNAEVDRKRADKLARRLKAHDDALRAELEKVSRP